MNEHDDRAAMLNLLDGLLAGMGRHMESVGDWAARLGGDDPSPLAQHFVNQLDDEWFDALPPDDFCEQIAQQVRARMAAGNPGWPHLWAHIQRVTGVALALADEADVDPVLAYVMGLCHDVAKLEEDRTGDPHEETGAVFAGRVLRGHLTSAEIAAIQAAILKESGDVLGDVLHDADKLDKIGAAGIVRRVSAGVRRSGLIEALWRVEDDAARFPAMQFDLSDDLAYAKLAFQDWFLPRAEAAIGGEQ